MSKRRLEFTIGDWVQVAAVARFTYADSERICIRDKQSFTAQVTGVAYRKLGQYERGYGGGGSLEDYEPPSLAVSGTVFVYKVRRGLANKEIDVLPDDLAFAVNHVKAKLPIVHADQPEWDERVRQELREAALKQPRINGRFAKSN